MREIGLAPQGGLDPAQLAAELAGGVRVLVLTNPHTPTGRVAPREELDALAELCRPASATPA